MTQVTQYEVTAEEHAQSANYFSHHAPFGDQAQRYEFIRSEAGYFWRKLLENCPRSRRALEECVMRANQSIAVNEVPS